ncbi:hypothetical protein [Nostoc sp. NMS8]|uniref:hypothetical protein n=1 Tax=Nostoc sp. NMS8 TaxID=2815392 RepID=UPI0025E1A174|nr:hypothetical protein [Nostoc sp. NMS8]MBN3963068.1 hypothetical protein [Nostoc sp. NMS8]
MSIKSNAASALMPNSTMSTTGYAYALQKTSKIKRSLLCKSECDAEGWLRLRIISCLNCLTCKSQT